MIRVAVVNFARGGVFAYGVHYFSSLVQLNEVEAELYILRSDYESYKDLLSELEGHLVVLDDSRVASVLIELCRQLKRRRVDVVHDTAGTSSKLSPYLTLALSGKRLISTLHDPVPHSGAPYTMGAFLKRVLLSHISTCVIVHGVFNKKLLASRRWARGGNVVSIDHGCVKRSVSPVRISRQDEELTILFFGNMRPDKGVSNLKKIFCAVYSYIGSGRESDLGVKFLVAGRSSLGPGYIKNGWQARVNGIVGELKQLPCVEVIDRYVSEQEKHELFTGSHIVIMPYDDASQSGVLCDAISYGRCIISTKVGAISEVLQDGRDAILVDSPDNIAQIIIELLDDPQRVERLGAAAYIKGQTELSWESIAGSTVELYRGVS